MAIGECDACCMLKPFFEIAEAEFVLNFKGAGCNGLLCAKVDCAVIVRRNRNMNLGNFMFKGTEKMDVQISDF